MIQGNDVLVKCKIPSFVADFVSVVGWIDDKLNPLESNILNHYSTSKLHTLLRSIKHAKINIINNLLRTKYDKYYKL